MASQHDETTTLGQVSEDATQGGCPVAHGASLPHPASGDANQQWWKNRLNLKILAKEQPVINPHDPDFDYPAAFETLDLAEVKKDIAEVLTTSKDWWPADFGNYGPFMIRMAWHAAGTYRSQDGRGGGGTGQQRFAPLNSWPDNVSLDKARRLLWPVKKKYGQNLSWADLMILTGNVAHEIMGMPTYGFSGGRIDAYEPEDDVYWGPETEWTNGGAERYRGDRELDNPLAAVEMGLIYVNPEGPEGEPDPVKSARDIRETFKRMGMNDEETVALIGGGHTFGKTHGAGTVPEHVGPEPEGAPMEQMGLGWKSSYKSGKGIDTIGSGLEVTWTYHPTRWDNEFFHILYAYEWELFQSPAGANQWRPVNGGGSDMVPEADGSGRREPRMLTSDLALRFDPEYDKIARRFKDDFEAFHDAYSRAWFKLTHRDMGPISRHYGPEVPTEELVWMDPIPAPASVPGDAEVKAVKDAVAAAGLSVPAVVKTVWAAASTYRGSDFRGGANGGRIRLEPQRSWEVNEPAVTGPVIEALEKIAAEQGVSFADTLVLAGNWAIEKAAADGGVPVQVPFTPGRGDSSQEQTDVESFGYLEPKVDGFRNYDPRSNKEFPAEFALVDRANLLGLSAPEMTVLVAGLRVLGANYGDSKDGVWTENVGVLSNDFLQAVTDIDTQWEKVSEGHYKGVTADGKELFGTRNDLVFGSNSELRTVSEVYAADDAKEKFVKDFVKAWTKIMDADRYDVQRKNRK
ncbi:Catalase / Peroxidase [Micrococcus lylae]|uniref:Catalase-peroxidase n=2 Tax=Micrococcus lylae TaxID=1273 RepID=A0A1R4JFU1_9MICC|nr:MULTISPECIES: catalase/peroxidase HPI [Micrococcus]OFR88015.1 hydroperoxidase [Micrococcus sp. HMSC067E09]PNL17092.1 catalase/peroxidase HPI [Micrococcus sp. FDAARGOS_333]TFH99940.1 catalase/peroxidase HPI [Micrococcus lylae]SJN30665.1 Catalase / Peroxidase [Micrococcus lylae]